MRLNMSNTKNFIDNKIVAIQAKRSASKPEGRNSRTSERETFFEKFGTLFKQRSTHFLLQAKTDVTLQDETGGAQELLIAKSTRPQINPSTVAAAAGEGIPNVANGYASIDALYDEDATGDLYEKVLQEIINGNFNEQEVTEKALFSYAQEVFNLNDRAQEEILKRARSKSMSEAYLKVELVEAILNERPSVPGAFNPFVIMYLQTNQDSRQKSTICKGTLHPVWKQCFAM